MTHATTNHTPGPWYVANTSGEQGLICSEHAGENIAVAYDEKDAPLIAAAPDMLATLMEAVDVSGFSLSGPTDPRAAEHGEPAWVCRARAIIAEVTQVRP